MKEFNPDLGQFKPFHYGCNCQFSGCKFSLELHFNSKLSIQADRPISDPGFGEPLDELDSVCKKYRNCVQCAKQQYGDICIPEQVEYTYPSDGVCTVSIKYLGYELYLF